MAVKADGGRAMGSEGTRWERPRKEDGATGEGGSPPASLAFSSAVAIELRRGRNGIDARHGEGAVFVGIRSSTGR